MPYLTELLLNPNLKSQSSAMAFLLQLRTRTKMNTFTNPSLFHFFSTSNSNDDEPESTATSTDDTASTTHNSSFSYFSDVKKVLKQGQSTSSLSTPRNPSNSSFTVCGSTAPTPFKAASLDEIRKNLSQFRRRYSDPNSVPPSSPSSNQISLQEIYRRNMVGKPGESTPNADLKRGKIEGRLSFDAIRESVRNIKQNVEPSGSDRKDGQLSSLSAFAQSLRKEPSDSTGSRTSSTVFGGTGALPTSIFGKELREKERGERSDETKMEYLKIYKHEELGEKLRKLRPQAKGGDWFSLRELNDRLVKLRDMEEKETKQSTVKGFNLNDFRDILIEVKVSENKERQSILQRLNILDELGRTPSFMLQPPKEHLVEKYFHPDNMSSDEKLKIELARIRDEFKMSESDCGSFRVQVAQLTTKIKHLSSVLHKKDKHSRKGLIAMVQKRKRLLKYLRRTDWDSYCFVISKLGLRDNPDIKC